VATVSQGSTKERFRFISQFGSDLGVRYLCNWLNVSPAGFYRWRNRPESNRVKEDKSLSAKVQCIFDASRGVYGSPRIHAALKRQGVNVGRKRVERLMRERGITARVAKVYRRNKLPYKFYTKMGNLRINEPKPNKINQQWVGDLTYINVNHKWHYLAVVMDLYSRRILGWNVSRYKNAPLTLSVINKAIAHRQYEPGLIFHTDRGSEYGAYLIQDELKHLNIRSSMNRPESITDNAHMESFFHSLKSEYIHGMKFTTIEELRAAAKSYIDDFYNPCRLHSGLGYCSPIEYEGLAA